VEARFSTPVQTGPGPYPSSCIMSTGSFLGVKRPGRDDDHPPTTQRRGHERVELYFYLPSGPLWPVIGRTFTFTTFRKNTQICNFMKFRPVGAQLFHADGEDGQTDMTELIVAFINFANALKNWSLWGYISRGIQSHCCR